MKKRVFAALLLAALMIAACAQAEHICTFGHWKPKRNPTCMEAGLEFRYCRYCDHWEQRDIPKLPHDIPEWTITVEPTCVKKGSKTGVCNTCGNTIRHFIDMLEHEYSTEMTVTREPTCTQDGKGAYTCTGCGKAKTERIPKLGHDWKLTSVAKEPTCHKTGKGTKVCQRCNKEQTGQLDKLEHVFTDWTITAEPAGEKKGTREHTCTLCGDVVSERFYWEGTLYEGMEPCEEVIRLQEMLRDLGYYSGNIRSGTFGSLTGKAVSAFRKANGMSASVIADPDTVTKLTEIWEAKFGAEKTAL